VQLVKTGKAELARMKARDERRKADMVAAAAREEDGNGE
jgi:hypothetical protein